MNATAAVIEFALAGLLFGTTGVAIVGALYIIYGLVEVAR